MELSEKWMAISPDEPYGLGPFDSAEEAKKADKDWRSMPGEEDMPENLIVQLSAAAWTEFQENGGSIEDFVVTDDGKVLCFED
jgi:hypothetical protein